MMTMVKFNDAGEFKDFMRYCYTGPVVENSCGGLQEVSELEDWIAFFGFTYDLYYEHEELEDIDLVERYLETKDFSIYTFPCLALHVNSESFDRIGSVEYKMFEIFEEKDHLSVATFKKRNDFYYDHPFEEFVNE